MARVMQPERYKIKSVTKQSVTTSALIDLGDNFAVLQNLGAGDLYISGATPATTNDFKIASGEKTFLLSGKVYAVSSATSDVRIMYVNVIN